MNNLNNLYPERTYMDAKKMMPYLNKVFYEYNKQNPDEYRTVTFRLNVFNSRVTALYSNYVTGVPTDNMQPLQPHLLSSIMRYNAIQNAPFH